MEGSPPTRELIDDLVARTGHPPAAFRTLAKHGELDPDHKDELDRTVDSLPLEPNHEMVLGYSAMSTAELLTRAFEELLQGFETVTGGAHADFFSGGPGTDTTTDFNAGDGDTSDGT